MLLKQDKIKTFLAKKKNIGVIYAIVIVGVLLLSAGSFVKPAQQTETATAQHTDTRLCKDMEKILSQIQGVGNVSVMITYKSSATSVLAKDTSESTTEDSDGKDTKREEKNVLIGSGSTQKPYVLKEETPRVMGVVVVAKGGGDAKIKREITEAVKALCSIGANNIKVFERK
ncbi:MAG: hypothetical protein IJT38_00185 [Clostridia bacterium]|nr:hypothetical protein [Clostridia bacterium]